MKNKYYAIKFLFKGILGYIAYYSLFPGWLSPLLHKIRGVKIKNVRKTYIAPNVLIDSIYPDVIEIEEEVYLTRGVKIISHTNYTPPIQKIMGKENIVKPVIIKKGAFIGVNSIILQGVIVGECSIVAAGSVVTKNVPANTIVGGNPAKIIGKVKSD